MSRVLLREAGSRLDERALCRKVAELETRYADPVLRRAQGVMSQFGVRIGVTRA
jgi:hypothetical protein